MLCKCEVFELSLCHITYEVLELPLWYIKYEGLELSLCYVKYEGLEIPKHDLGRFKRMKWLMVSKDALRSREIRIVD